MRRYGVTGDELRALRVVARLSQQDVARHYPTSQGYISVLELRAVCSPTTAERYKGAVEAAIAAADAEAASKARAS